MTSISESSASARQMPVPKFPVPPITTVRISLKLTGWNPRGKRLRIADEVALADLDATVAQDVVRGHSVEVEIRQGKPKQVLHAFPVDLARAELKVDVPFFAAVDLRELDGLDEFDGLGDARLQFDQVFLGVLVLGNIHAGQPRHRALGSVAGDLYLPFQRKHVWEEAHVRQDGGIDLLRLSVGLSLVQYCRKVLEGVCKAWRTCLVHG